MTVFLAYDQMYGPLWKSLSWSLLLLCSIRIWPRFSDWGQSETQYQAIPAAIQVFWLTRHLAWPFLRHTCHLRQSACRPEMCTFIWHTVASAEDLVLYKAIKDAYSNDITKVFRRGRRKVVSSLDCYFNRFKTSLVFGPHRRLTVDVASPWLNPYVTKHNLLYEK